MVDKYNRKNKSSIALFATCFLFLEAKKQQTILRTIDKTSYCFRSQNNDSTSI